LLLSRPAANERRSEAEETTMNEPNAGGGRRPLAVFAVVERDSRPTIWIRVGSAFTNRDGSMNLVLDAFPIGSNRLHVREQRSEDAGRSGPPGADPSARPDRSAPTGAPCPAPDAEARP
jgi:hypothetical protein